MKLQSRVVYCGVVMLAGISACASKNAPEVNSAATPTLPVLVKKVAVSWAFKPSATAVEVFLALTDETGKVTSYPIGAFAGDCSVVTTPAVENSLTAASCTSGGIGVELHVVSSGTELIMLKIPVAPGAQVDALSGTRLPSIPVPLDAKIEAGK